MNVWNLIGKPMKKTRTGVFETNSSSTHSIVIAEDKSFVLDLLPVEGGVCRVYAGEFEWEERRYNDAATKASYCLTYVKHIRDLTCATAYEAVLEAVIRKETGAQVVEFIGIGMPDSEISAMDWGLIDHQSSDVCEEAFLTEAALRAFIFNRNSTLLTDNDNH
jgi:hypothetical protein